MSKNGKMALWIVVLLALLALAWFGYRTLSAQYTPEDTPQSGQAAAQTAPDFTVTDVDGGEVTLSAQQGKPVLLNFWATWCGPCKSELPAFEQAWKDHGTEITFMMVNLTDGSRDTVEGVKTFISDGGYTFPVYFDTEGSAATAYSVYSIPMTVLIDAEGNVLETYSGALSEDRLAACVTKLLEQ